MPTLRRQSLIAAAIIVIAVVLATVLFLLRPAPEQVEVKQQPLIVDVAVAEKQTLSISLHSQGTVKPRTETQLASEVSGQIVTVSDNFESGNLVEKGEVLLQIDDRQYKAAVVSARAAISSAKSALIQEKGRAAVAKRDLQRYPRKHVSREARELALRLPQLEEAKARYNSAVADFRQAKINLEKTKIRAPYRGIVQSRLADEGDIVGAGSQLGSLFSIDTAEIRLPIPLDRLSNLDLPVAGREVSTEAVLKDELDNHWRARIIRTEGALDERSRVLYAVAEVPDPYALDSDRPPLRNGTFVTANISGKAIDNLIAIPRHILRAGNKIWVVDAQDRLINREVEVLRSDGDLAYVKSGLENGERVCLSSIPNAITGTEVQIQHTVTTSSLADSELPPPVSDDAPAAEALSTGDATQ
ncbi:efflux RND transporter periplasmic adaptor subunit [Spongiibacter nanhainus]|uniref:Efflux RND transporter periplasmic adaptor subunit n=1 Tax=Spongiibacter nanhainus TaxID=2794344 RepID=A0A7T4R3E2_9GAMM|nr:efflux RND transporter periplasmic adaptor subunit [Spongiibacter nanhainus]QQD19764.1 efflux RND transporter periplasmic adaptor subunit [Spongiibacter nanhainus]